LAGILIGASIGWTGNAGASARRACDTQCRIWVWSCLRAPRDAGQQQRGSKNECSLREPEYRHHNPFV